MGLIADGDKRIGTENGAFNVSDIYSTRIGDVVNQPQAFSRIGDPVGITQQVIDLKNRLGQSFLLFYSVNADT